MKKGFTLVEVVITLGIIGVVAALVIPQVITKIDKHKTLSVLKRGYSDLNKYIKDFDRIYSCDGTLENCTPNENEFINEFSNYLETKQNFKRINVSWYYGRFDNGVKVFNLIPDTQRRHALVSPTGEYIYSIGVNQIDNGTYSIFKKVVNGKVLEDDKFRAMIWIVTNPKKYYKEHARLGYDMFALFVMQSERTLPGGAQECGNGTPWIGWCYFCRDWHIENSCNPELPNSNGWGCLARIIEDGWQINYR